MPQSRLYTVCPCQGISENADLRRHKGEYREKNGNCRKRDKGAFWMLADFWIVELPCFIEIRRGGGNEENGDVDPIGGLADHAVVGVKKDGNQADSCEYSAEFHTPKIPTVAEEKALHDAIKEHWPKE